jgi:hypothetical protein
VFKFVSDNDSSIVSTNQKLQGSSCNPNARRLKQNMKTTWILFIAISSMIVLPVVAQTSNAPSAAVTEVLHNDSIMKLTGFKLGDAVIVEKIKTTHCDFDTSVAALEQLKNANVSDAVIGAMLSVKTSTIGDGSASAALATDPNDPKSPHEAGIWLYDECSGKPKMTQLEPSVYSQGRSGSAMFMGWGATVKQEAVIRSAHAQMSATNRQPVFYFYFERTEAGLSDSHGATSPNEYILAQFETVGKDNQRRLVIGSMNAYAGGTSGAEAKSVRSFDFEKLAPGIYKVVSKEPLPNGEYGFFYGGSPTGGYGIFAANSTGGKVFDFGITGSTETEPTVSTQTDKPDSKKDGGIKWPFKKKSATPNVQTNQPTSVKS